MWKFAFLPWLTTVSYFSEVSLLYIYLVTGPENVLKTWLSMLFHRNAIHFSGKQNLINFMFAEPILIIKWCTFVLHRSDWSRCQWHRSLGWNFRRLCHRYYLSLNHPLLSQESERWVSVQNGGTLDQHCSILFPMVCCYWVFSWSL